MRSLFNRPSNREFKRLVFQLTCGSVGWAALVVFGFGALFFMMALSVGMPASDFALDFILDAAVPVSDIIAKCWLVAFFVAAVCFGGGQELAAMYLSPPLRNVVARITQTAPVFAPSVRLHPTIFASEYWGFDPIARGSRLAEGTATDLAGPAPQLK